jgi:hypothetical protein
MWFDLALSGLRSTTAMFAPAFANRRAMAAPIPVAAPVTTAVWPFNSNI